MSNAEIEELKKAIMEIINRCDDIWIVNQIYRFSDNMTKGGATNE